MSEPYRRGSVEHAEAIESFDSTTRVLSFHYNGALTDTSTQGQVYCDSCMGHQD